MRDPRYSKPFQNWQSAAASLGLLFLNILSVSIPLGSLGRYMSASEFTTISMYSTFASMAMALSISISMAGFYYSRHIITILFTGFSIAAVVGHIYYYEAIGWKNFTAAGLSVLICALSIKLVNSEMYRSFIFYRKMHFKSGRDYAKSLKRNNY